MGHLISGVYTSFELMVRAHGRSPTYLLCSLISNALGLACIKGHILFSLARVNGKRLLVVIVCCLRIWYPTTGYPAPVKKLEALHWASCPAIPGGDAEW